MKAKLSVMKIRGIYTFLSIFGVIFLYSCQQQQAQQKEEVDPLPSWNTTVIKNSILSYVEKSAQIIPVEDRIAVFDMDGTVACEAPLWFEMYIAVHGLNQQSSKNPALLNEPEYQFAQKLAVNPVDKWVADHWVTSSANYIDSMIWKAYAGTYHEAYVDSARSYLSRTKDQKFGMPLSDMFYQPMIELIQYLTENQFSVYIVSGSIQGVIWSVCPQTIGLDRDHLIGTRQILTPVYASDGHKTRFVIRKGIFQPKNDKNGKSLNIYAHIGKVPVFAFGNTSGDFGMFHLASGSPYPNMELLLNHDDSIREYAYPPYHGKPVPAWQDSLIQNNWKQVDMSEEFKTVWMTK